MPSDRESGIPNKEIREIEALTVLSQCRSYNLGSLATYDGTAVQAVAEINGTVYSLACPTNDMVAIRVVGHML